MKQGSILAAKLGGKGSVVELTGLSGSTPAMERHQGFVSATKSSLARVRRIF